MKTASVAEYRLPSFQFPVLGEVHQGWLRSLLQPLSLSLSHWHGKFTQKSSCRYESLEQDFLHMRCSP